MSAVWDALTSIVYVAGALIVDRAVRLFGAQVPFIVQFVLFCLEIGFALAAIGSIVKSLITLIRNFKELGRELHLKQAAAALRKVKLSSRVKLGSAIVLIVSIIVGLSLLVATFLTPILAVGSIIFLVLVGAMALVKLTLMIHFLGEVTSGLRSLLVVVLLVPSLICAWILSILNVGVKELIENFYGL